MSVGLSIIFTHFGQAELPHFLWLALQMTTSRLRGVDHQMLTISTSVGTQSCCSHYYMADRPLTSTHEGHTSFKTTPPSPPSSLFITDFTVVTPIHLLMRSGAGPGIYTLIVPRKIRLGLDEDQIYNGQIFLHS